MSQTSARAPAEVSADAKPRDAAAAPEGEARYFDRDMSWLEFNRRVLALATDARTPLLERVKFLAIYGSNLDEFVMKRVGLFREVLDVSPPGGARSVSASDQLARIARVIRELDDLHADTFENDIAPALREEGADLTPYASLDERERGSIDSWFMNEVFPTLTPIAVDPGHRFPFISNLSVSLGVLVREPEGRETLFARVKAPTTVPGWVRVPGAAEGEPDLLASGSPTRAPSRYVPLHEVIANNLDDVFPGMVIEAVAPFRLTRSAADEGGEGEGEDLLEDVKDQLRRRRFARAVRLEVLPGTHPAIVDNLIDELKLRREDVYERRGVLDAPTLMEIASIDRADLKWPAWTPMTPKRLADPDTSMFAEIRKGDLLVHHPYDSFEASAQRFIAEAARDPDVLAIKQTIYRTSRDSPFISSLIRAAEENTQVAALVELRARFDEKANVRIAGALESAGVHVAYGVLGLKTHCKLSLVVRRDPDGVRAYAHVGTGNYHPKTASLYTDLGLFTCDPAITSDVIEVFNLLTGRSRRDEYKKLMVAPTSMKEQFLALIDDEIAHAKHKAETGEGAGGRIAVKMNSMQDREMTEKLYEASQAGVRVELMVRGFCCLRPGVQGLSENITVTSVIGRFLEHSRIFHFGAGHEDPVDGVWFIGSGDWMYRNLHRRVETVCPVEDRVAREKLEWIFRTMRRDQRKAWDLGADGRYTQRTPAGDADPDSPEVTGTFETMIRARRAEG